MRTLLIAIAAALAAASMALAAEPVRVGIVPFRAINAPAVEGFKDALAQQGFGEGRQVQFDEIPATGDLRQLEASLPALLARKPRLVFVVTTPAAQVVVRTATAAGVPVVFAPISDPIAAGLVPALRHPGGLATGVRLSPTNGMRLAQLVKAAGARRVYFPFTSSDASARSTLRQVSEVAPALGVELLLDPLGDDAAPRVPPGAEAIFVPQDSRLESRIDELIDVARQRRLAMSVPSLWQVERGALLSYGFDLADCGRQAGRIAAQVLAGKRAGDLPVETAQNRLWVNLRAAREAGIELPDALLQQAQRIVR